MKKTIILCLSLAVLSNLNAQQTEMMDVEGAITISDSETDSSKIGTIRFNTRTNDFEGFNGTEWLSLTVQDVGGSGNNNSSSNYSAGHVGMINSVENNKERVFGSGYTFIGGTLDIYEETAVVGGFGEAHLFKRTEKGWQHDSQLVGDGMESGAFGSDVAIDSNIILVGDWANSAINPSSGAVYVFQKIGNNWNLQTRIDRPDVVAGNSGFGYSIDLEDDMAIFGAPFDDLGGDKRGSAYIFRNLGNSWGWEKKLVPADGQDDNQFGYSVSIDGIHAAVGCPFDNDGATSSGSVYVYDFNGVSWLLQSKILHADLALLAEFGTSVSLLNERLCVGAPFSTSVYEIGEVFVFELSGGNWIQTAQLEVEQVNGDDAYGQRVEQYGDQIIISAPNHEVDGIESGAAFLFTKEGDFWRATTQLMPRSPISSSSFGFNVSIYKNSIVVGAPNIQPVGGRKQGGVYFY